MPILWIPHWVSAPDFAVQRQQVWGIAVGWWDMSILQYDRESILQEVPFGGYKLVIKFKSHFWDWASSAWRFDDLLEDIYAIDPFTGLIVNALDQYNEIGMTPAGLLCWKMYQPIPPPFIAYLPFPPNPNPGYWLPPNLSAPTAPFVAPG